jgi:hypothetical protein
MDDGNLDGKVRGTVGYSRYPGPLKVRVIRKTLETLKQPQELNNIFLLFYSLFNTPINRVTKLKLRDDN